MPRFKDLSGQRFGRLLALHRDPAPPVHTKDVYFVCLCDCGNTTSVPRRRLVTRNTQSCGCLKAEQRKHALGWAHPDVANPRRRELYAQKRAMGYVRIQNDEATLERKRANHQARRQKDPEGMRERWNAACKRYRATRPGLSTEQTRQRRARIHGASVNDFTKAQWQEMQETYDHRCAYCGKRAKGHLTQDHLTPLSQGGAHTATNIVPACRSCNSTKGNRAVLSPVQPVLFLLAPSEERNLQK